MFSSSIYSVALLYAVGNMILVASDQCARNVIRIEIDDDFLLGGKEIDNDVVGNLLIIF